MGQPTQSPTLVAQGIPEVPKGGRGHNPAKNRHLIPGVGR